MCGIVAKGRSRIIDVYCTACGNQLYRYEKNIPGRLIKLYAERILRYYTPEGVSEVPVGVPEIPEGTRFSDLDGLSILVNCAFCGQDIARVTGIHGKLAYKVIQGKVRVR